MLDYLASISTVEDQLVTVVRGLNLRLRSKPPLARVKRKESLAELTGSSLTWIMTSSSSFSIPEYLKVSEITPLHYRVTSNSCWCIKQVHEAENRFSDDAASQPAL
ncbi:hypothetical protein RRG08_002712 [Elysia crispata]|uniref:Uncharacterized protein n=1 Tax=Elysia crispata TaxID=231223 RepID=A0AAE0XTT0_9GAST|nr:hypothetical protein RRG08_002712 [Elysia crispata]